MLLLAFFGQHCKFWSIFNLLTMQISQSVSMTGCIRKTWILLCLEIKSYRSSTWICQSCLDTCAGKEASAMMKEKNVLQRNLTTGRAVPRKQGQANSSPLLPPQPPPIAYAESTNRNRERGRERKRKEKDGSGYVQRDQWAVWICLPPPTAPNLSPSISGLVWTTRTGTCTQQ